MTRSKSAPRRFPLLARLRTPVLMLGIAISTIAAAQSAQDVPPQAPTNPDLGPAFATRNAAYVPILLDEIPGWADESLGEMYANFSTNCKAMKRRDAWAPLCAKLARLPREDAAMRQFMHDEFYAYQMLTPTRSATGGARQGTSQRTSRHAPAHAWRGGVAGTALTLPAKRGRDRAGAGAACAWDTAPASAGGADARMHIHALTYTRLHVHVQCSIRQLPPIFKRKHLHTSTRSNPLSPVHTEPHRLTGGSTAARLLTHWATMRAASPRRGPGRTSTSPCARVNRHTRPSRAAGSAFQPG